MDHRVKIKEAEKMDKYLDLAREMKNLWNMKVMVIPVIICALGTVSQGVAKEWTIWKSEEQWELSSPKHC